MSTLRTERSGLLEKTCVLCSACLSLGRGDMGLGGEGRTGEREREKKTFIIDSDKEDKPRGDKSQEDKIRLL